jgi:hypothetical protein
MERQPPSAAARPCIGFQGRPRRVVCPSWFNATAIARRGTPLRTERTQIGHDVFVSLLLWRGDLSQQTNSTWAWWSIEVTATDRRKTVELCNDEDGFRALGMGERLPKLGPIGQHVAFAGLNLGILGEERHAVVDVLKYGGALPFQAEAGTCPVGRWRRGNRRRSGSSWHCNTCLIGRSCKCYNGVGAS